MKYTKMFAVIEHDILNPVFGVYMTREDAQEIILSECQEWVYKVMMTEDPEDFLRDDHWDWVNDYRWLMRDTGNSFFIQEIDVEVK